MRAIVNFEFIIKNTNREFVMSKQLLKSGTSIGANIKEAQQRQSKADFYAKLLG